MQYKYCAIGRDYKEKKNIGFQNSQVCVCAKQLFRVPLKIKENGFDSVGGGCSLLFQNPSERPRRHDMFSVPKPLMS